MSELYLPPFCGARWAISRAIAGKRIYLIQNSSMDDEEDIVLIFQALEIANTAENRMRYFPVWGDKGPCPTLELLELFSTIDRLAKDRQKEIGV